MKRRVFAIGETLLDIIFEKELPVNAVPGGSMLNAAVSLGRAGIHSHLVSEFGNDPTGKIIDSFLERNNVQHSWSYRYDTNKTSIALAFLDEDKNADYTFYHDSPQNLQGLLLPDLNNTDIVLFGSLYSLKPQRRHLIKKLLLAISLAGGISVYDPNIRKKHHKRIEEYHDTIMENFGMASIIKGSDEDFEHIFGTREPQEVYSKIRPYCQFLYISRGSKDLILITPEFTTFYEVPAIKPVSTIGAGDNLNAGIIFGLIAENASKNSISELSRQSWDNISHYGLEFAKASCLSYENYVPWGFDPISTETKAPID
jgi:fructokinase